MVERLHIVRPAWPDPNGELVRYSDYATLAAEVERLRKERDLMAREWCDFCEMMGVTVDAQEAVASVLLARAEKAGADVDRLRAINANLMGDDEDAPRYTTKRLKAEIAKAVEAARAEASAAVKVLEWNGGYASTMFGGGYLITYYAGMQQPAKLETRGWWDGEGTGYFETVDAARAAAQADYERRILSALGVLPRLRNNLSTLTAEPFAPQEAGTATVRPLEEWHEDFGDVVWWTWQDDTWLGEPSYIGTPNDSDWPGYHTHWTPHPAFPPYPVAAAAEETSDA